jgi:hypothetical protein
MITVGIARIHAGNTWVSCSQSRFSAAIVLENRHVMNMPRAEITSPTSSRSSEVGERTIRRSAGAAAAAACCTAVAGARGTVVSAMCAGGPVRGPVDRSGC